MFSGKGLKLRHEHLLPALLLVGLFFALLVGYPWYTLSAIAIGFVCSIPFSRRSYRRHKERSKETAGEPAEDDKQPTQV